MKHSPKLFFILLVALLIGIGTSTSFVGCDGTSPSAEKSQKREHTNNDGGNQSKPDQATFEQTPTEKTTGTIKPHDKPTGCHPFAVGKEDCILPYPSSYYLIKDSKTETGYRVAYPKGVLPVSQYDADTKIPISTKILNQKSGFSPSTPIMAFFPERVDPALLVKSNNVKASLEKESLIYLIEFGSQKRIPFFAEVDKTVKKGQPQVLLIRPMIRLKPNARYAVILRKGLKSIDGKALTQPKAFVRLAKGDAPKTPAEAALNPSLQETLKEAEKAGLKREDLLLAWDFHTAGDKVILDEMLSMRDEMLKKIGDKGPEYKIKRVYNFDEKVKKDVMRIVEGTFKVPTFLDSDKPGAKIVRDAQGKPKMQGYSDYFFQLHIPRCALKKQTPLPIMQFGHGIFGGAKGEMDSGYERGLINRLCMVQIGHDWIGLSAEDRGYVAATVIPDMNKMIHVAHRLQQAHINAIALTRLILKRLIHDEALKVNGKTVIDGKEIYYLGISNGAIQGSGFMALSPDITKGVLNVGGGPWSLMMSRSSDFALLNTIMKVFYKNPIERQLLIAFTQVYFDIIDPATFAAYVLKDPKRMGIPKKTILIQESIGDAQVPNIATRTWARTMGVVALKSLVQPVFGLVEKEGPLSSSAYTQFDTKPTPYPKDENVPPKNNRAHEGARRNLHCIEQMETFFKPNGKIQHFCKGGCDPD